MPHLTKSHCKSLTKRFFLIWIDEAEETISNYIPIWYMNPEETNQYDSNKWVLVQSKTFHFHVLVQAKTIGTLTIFTIEASIMRNW
jgi:hypothetical protein